MSEFPKKVHKILEIYNISIFVQVLVLKIYVTNNSPFLSVTLMFSPSIKLL